MVDTPKLTPQAFSKRSSSGVPTLTAQTPNLRAAPSVSVIAADSLADTFIAMADDSQRLQAMQARNFEFGQDQFEQSMKEVETLQVIEAERELDAIKLRTQAAVRAVRENVSDAEEIPAATKEAYETIQFEAMEDANLSDFQRRYLTPRLDDLKTQTASEALTYQTELRRQEAQFSIAEKSQANNMLAYDNPSQDNIDQLIKEGEDYIDRIALGVTALEKAKLKDAYREELTYTAMLGRIRVNPAATIASLEANETGLNLTADQKNKLLNTAEAELNSQRVEANRQRTEAVQVANSQLSSAYLQAMDGTAPLTPTDIETRPEFANASPSMKISVANSLASRRTKSGNPRLASEMKARIRQQRETDAPISVDEIYALADPSINTAPISAAEVNELVKEIEEPYDGVAERWLDSVAPSFKGIPGDTTELGDRRLFNLEQELRRRWQQEIDENRDPTKLLDPKSSMFIGDELRNYFMPTFQDLMDAQQQEFERMTSPEVKQEMQNNNVSTMSTEDLLKQMMGE